MESLWEVSCFDRKLEGQCSDELTWPVLGDAHQRTWCRDGLQRTRHRESLTRRHNQGRTRRNLCGARRLSGDI
jgi:hypothetical protein